MEFNNPIRLNYGEFQDRIFSILAGSKGPVLIQTLAETLQLPLEVVEKEVKAMIMNGAPLRFSQLPEGKAVGY